jgi:hypothetical protein
MRLFEISGNTEEEVFPSLRKIYFILNSCSSIDVLSPALISMRNIEIFKLNGDKQNLDFWIISSDRINKIYNEIKKLI